MMITWLADLVLVAHFCLAAFITLGLLALPVGAWYRWDWVRDRRFRLLHVGAIVWVAVQSVLAIRCPLTVWEDALRGATTQTGFVQRWVSRFLYYDLPASVFTVVYVAAAGATVGAWLLVPPNPSRRRAGRSEH